ncbi:MAG: hypothetical protein E2O39_04360 [Planctomycetota bacterium]|nr:MAG: hypothetical protein E2O39_04360 [Planctomycetota bacterium]
MLLAHDRSLARPALWATLAFAALAGGAEAQDLYVGGFSSLIYRGDPAAGNFELVGACGGAVHSMAPVGPDLLIGDVTGVIYRYDQANNSIGYLQDVDNDATALLVQGSDFLVGGTDGTVLRYATDGSEVDPTEVLTAPVPIEAMFMVGDVLFVGSSLGVVFRTDLDHDGGVFEFFGTCGGPIDSMVQHAGSLLLGTTGGVVYRLSLQTGEVTSSFVISNEVTALVLHEGELLSGGSTGDILRVDPIDGSPKGGDLQVVGDVQAMTINGVLDPGIAYCYGVGCPCGNDDSGAGCVNAGGQGAFLTGRGTASVSIDDLTLSLTQIPPNQFALFYMGATPIQLPFGNGILCSGAGGYGQFRFDIVNSGAGGFVSLGPGIVQYSEGNFPVTGHIVTGFTWFFQVWYRDAQGLCGSSFNTSNAFMATFQP